MVRARLPEPQSPAVKQHRPPTPRLTRGHRTTEPGRRLADAEAHAPRPSSGWRAMANEAIQGDERGTYLALGRPAAREQGIAYGARALWRRSRRSSPRPGKPATWRRGAGIRDGQDRRGTRNARRRNRPGRHPRTRQAGAAAGGRLSATVQPGRCTCIAYGKISANAGAMTPGVDRRKPWTGCRWRRSSAIIELLRQERYRWTPVRRVYIEKKNREEASTWASRRGRTSCCRK